nr:PilZ domain-containing protein [Planomonospora venezuelensis]
MVIPVRFAGVSPGPPERWRLHPLGEVRRLGRRRHERGGGGERMRVSTYTTQPAIVFDSTLLDLSEKALRCWAPAFDIAVGEQVHVRAVLSNGLLSQTGTVTVVREAPDGLGQHIVVMFRSPSASTVQLIRRYLFAWEPVHRRTRRAGEEHG